MGYPFVQARNYTRGRISPVKWVVFHDMEMAEKPTTAEACAEYFRTTTRQASAHYCVDSDSIVQCVRESDTAWAAPGANANGIHVEHAGFAAQTRDQWLDPFGKAMLAVSARLVADICRRNGIPAVKLTVAEVKAGKPGIISHLDLTDARIGGNTHTDPGRNFPWDYYMGLVRAASLAGSGGGTSGPVTGGGSTPIQQEDEVSWTEQLPVLGSDDKTQSAAYQLTSANVYAWRNNRLLTELTAQVAGMSAAVEALSKAAGVDPAQIAGIVDKAVRDRLSKISVVDNPGGA